MHLACEHSRVHLCSGYKAVAISVKPLKYLLQFGDLGLLNNSITCLIGARELLPLLLDKADLLLSRLLTLLQYQLMLLMETLGDLARRCRPILDNDVSVNLRFEQLPAGLGIDHLARVG